MKTRPVAYCESACRNRASCCRADSSFNLKTYKGVPHVGLEKAWASQEEILPMSARCRRVPGSMPSIKLHARKSRCNKSSCRSWIYQPTRSGLLTLRQPATMRWSHSLTTCVGKTMVRQHTLKWQAYPMWDLLKTSNFRRDAARCGYNLKTLAVTATRQRSLVGTSNLMYPPAGTVPG